MTAKQSATREKSTIPADRRYAVSANRDQARHRVRYVETGGAVVDIEECVFCEATPKSK